MAILYFIDEAKEGNGIRLTLQLQTLHNLAVILQMLTMTTSKAGILQTDFFNRIQIISLRLTAAHDPDNEGFRNVSRCVLNGIDWSQNQMKF